MARTLKDVYIVATKSNVKELNLLLKKLVIEGDNILFESESIESVYIDEPKDKQKVSLSELKRLIDTIPTREEITRLKRQISAYKTNLIVYKGDIEALRNTINQLHDDERKYVEKTNKDYNELSNMYFNKINEIERLKYDFEQLKNKKWYQIWK